MSLARRHALLRRSRGGGGAAPGIPAPAFNFDLTSTLPAELSFTRAGSRTAIVGGVLTTLSSNVPAFESWDGVNRGLSIEGSFTNTLTHSNNLSDGSWGATNFTKSTGGIGPDGVSTMQRGVETTINGVHELRKRPGSSAAGSTQCYSVFVKIPAGVARWGCRLRMSNEFNNFGPTSFFLLDGTRGHFSLPDTAVATGVTAGYDALANGIYRVWMSGAWVSTGNKEFTVGLANENAAPIESYAGAVTESIEFFGAQVNAGSRPASYIATTTAAASNVAEALTWATPPDLTQGTFVIEHDATSGALIGTGATAVVSATAAGKTAFAWGGTSSDLVNNGGATTAGAAPSWTDLRILGTSGGSNNAHIKSLKFYAQRLTVEQMQQLTAPTVVSTAAPGSWRAVSVDNRMAPGTEVPAASATRMDVRFRLKLGNFACSKLKLDFSNFLFPSYGTTSNVVNNAITIEAAVLERVTGVAEFVPITFSGARSKLLAINDKHVLCDEILPSAFTGWTEFPADTEFWFKGRISVAAGEEIPCSRWVTEPGARCASFTPGPTTASSVDATGDFTYSGTTPGLPIRGYCPILIGVPASGDPMTAVVHGDSLFEGVSTQLKTTRCYVTRALRNLGVPVLEFSRGGESQRSSWESSIDWKTYLAYVRVFVDGMGTNNENALLHFAKLYATIRANYGLDKIVHVGLFPKTANSGDWTSEGVQTGMRAFPMALDNTWASLKALGYIDANIVPVTPRGSDQSKWITNGTPFYATADGTHASPEADELARVEVQPQLAAVTVT